jgi:hypothetical protein
MSRILARALGEAAGPGPVRARLPMLFEPGLDLAADQEEITAVRAGSTPSAGPQPTQTPTVPVAQPPPVPPDLPMSPSPAAEHGPLAAPAPSWPAGFRPPVPVRPPAPARPKPPEDAAAAQPGRPWQAHPIRPELSGSTPPAVTGPQAPRLHPPDTVARAIRPAPPTGQAPGTAAHRVPVHPRPLPDGSPAAAARPPAGREARRTANAEPVVHISIGRVEIRADRAAARPPERQTGRPRSAAPDLSEYLQRRGRPR